ncbi:hypothetical protein ACW4FQ_32900, partial [Escherichia coli]
AELSAQLSQVQAYSDLLRVQTHEHNNQLGTIAGMIELGATQEALAFIGREAATEQTLLSFLMGPLPSPRWQACCLASITGPMSWGWYWWWTQT